jgi:hypothetical protein
MLTEVFLPVDVNFLLTYVGVHLSTYMEAHLCSMN